MEQLKHFLKAFAKEEITALNKSTKPSKILKVFKINFKSRKSEAK